MNSEDTGSNYLLASVWILKFHAKLTFNSLYETFLLLISGKFQNLFITNILTKNDQEKGKKEKKNPYATE